MQNWEEVQLAVAALRQRLGAALPSRPDAAIILGTGLSGLVERMEDPLSLLNKPDSKTAIISLYLPVQSEIAIRRKSFSGCRAKQTI